MPPLRSPRDRELGRRGFFHLGLAAQLAFAGSASRRALAGNDALAKLRPAKRCVVLFMRGGASQIDTFDPKPGRSTGGEFRAIESSVTGLRVSEHLPMLAARMHQLALIRTLTAKFVEVGMRGWDTHQSWSSPESSAPRSTRDY